MVNRRGFTGCRSTSSPAKPKWRPEEPADPRCTTRLSRERRLRVVTGVLYTRNRVMAINTSTNGVI